MLLLWDIDGTLIRGQGAGRRAMNRAFTELFGVDNAFDDMQMAGGLDLHFVEAVFTRHHIGSSFQDRYLEAYYQALADEVGGGKTTLMPGVREVLDRLEKSHGLFHALGTGNMEPGARIKLEVFGLNSYFPTGGFCEQPVARYQLLQAGVRKAGVHYGVEFLPTDVLVIGDTIRDVEAARKLGAKVLAVSTGGNTYEELAAMEPDWLVRNLTEMPIF